MNVSFTPEALADLRRIYDYIARFDEPAAGRIVSRIRQVVEIFEEFPMLGRVGIVDGTREFSVPGLPYVVVYRLASQTEIDILTVLHERQQWPPD